MKNIILITLLLCMNYSCMAQERKKDTVTQKKDTMEYFDINRFKDWDVDSDYTSYENDKFLKNGEWRARITRHNDGIQVEQKIKDNPTTVTKVYYLNHKLKVSAQKFYDMHRGIWKYYDEKGSLVKEVNWDDPYKFSIEDLIKKFKKDYDVDLENPQPVNYEIDGKYPINVYEVSRYEEKEHLNIPLYEVILRTDKYFKLKEYLIDGNTGKILFEDTIEWEEDIVGEGEYTKPLLNRYLDSIKSGKQ